MFAASTQQSVALVIFLLATVGWVLWIIANIRRAKPEVGAELELAPNRKPYYSDEELEGVRMERAQLFGLACLVIIGVGLPLYWLAEPGRQEGAIEFFQQRAASDALHHGQPVGGEALFAPTAEGGFNCAGCHGGLDGGTAPYTVTDPATGQPLRQVQWTAPALRYAALRYTEDQLRQILVYGRPYSPMPAWGLEGGGPMNAQQIDNLIAYLQKVAGVDPYEGAAENAQKAQEEMATAAEAELARLRGLEQSLTAAKADLATATTLTERTSIQNRIIGLEKEIAAGQDKTMGAALFNLNCARCHTTGFSYGEPEAPGGGGRGPALYNTRTQFPEEQDHVDFVTNGTEFGERYGRTGQSSGAMPYFGQALSEEQIAQIVNYERLLSQRAERAREAGS
jgi:mono/diheme cytochrome c family protein